MTDEPEHRDDVSSRMLIAIRDFAAMKLGHELAHRAFESAVKECGVTVARATDPRAWVPLEVLEAVHRAFLDTLGPELLIDTATWVIPARRDLSAMSLSALSTPDVFYANLDRARSFFARHLRFDMQRQERGRFRAELHYREDVPKGGVSCKVGRSVLHAIPLLFDLPPATVEERSCRDRGDERCTYEVSFASDPAYAVYGGVFGLLAASVGYVAAPGLAWLVAPVIGFLLGRELQHHRARGLMARVSEEQRRVLAENETDFQRRFDEIKALNDTLEARIEERTAAMENAMRVLREQSATLRGSLDEMAQLSTDVIEAGALKELQHEIANPMSYVIANLEAIPGTADLGELERVVRDVRAGVDDIASVVAWFLDRYGPPGAEPSRFDVSAEIRSAVRLVQKRTSDRVEVHVSAEPIFVPGRGRQLAQVLVNLLKNATEMVDRGNVWITAHAKGESAVILVRDDGPGMTPAVLARIFEPGFTVKPGGKGSGLGLPISRRIVERHRGTITAESAPGKGTTFRIELPLWTEASSSLGRSPPA